MKERSNSTPFHAKRGYRLLSSVFGAFLVAAGAYTLLTAPSVRISDLLIIAGLAVVGFNHLLSAHAGKKPWLSKIGPLP